ncbi:PAS domain-containing protein [Halodesulfurarchaeum sp. HSR-GB]|uniref:sensor histidine kinase n=1 Tax=Halodesulfurarchaeum sp. HSR-GB TaxID=3074077 RepID=UPI0028587934|nr:PAS domain-containing protein [Halodesulfurarchaeum sp. HSR-GB]MDR5655724.1 PAS domain-containing protein [Halodesulfurarchaeum sp. HSR-GB]
MQTFSVARELLGAALDTLPSNVAILDAEGEILWTNASWQEFGVENDIELAPDTVGVNYLDATAAGEDEYALAAHAGLDELLQGQRTEFELEYPCHSPDEKRWFLLRASAFTIGGDRYAIVAHVDITDRVLEEQTTAQYKLAIEGAGEAIAAVDEDYRLLFANEAYRNTHYLGPSVTGMHLSDVLGPQDFETIEPYVELAMAGQEVAYRMTRTRSGKPDRVFDIRYYPLGGEGFGPEGVVATMRDVSKQVEREQHLLSLDRLLRHNLRNDLTVIRGYAAMIADRGDAEIASLTGPITDAADRLLAEAEKERQILAVLSGPPEQTTVDLQEMVERVIEDCNEDQPNVTIIVAIPEDLEVTTIRSVEQAIRELIENAIVHNPADEPMVRITAERADDRATVMIGDDGPGIPTEERIVVTECREIDPLVHSSGMGLWMVKRIVTRAGGTLQFGDSDLGGSCVTMTIEPKETVDSGSP